VYDDHAVDHTEAEQWISTFLEKFPKTAQFLKDTAESAHENGFIRTLLNRRRFWPPACFTYLSKPRLTARQCCVLSRLFPTINFEAYAHKAERQAVNSVIQGTAADLVKLAMLSIDRALVAEEQRELADAVRTLLEPKFVPPPWVDRADGGAPTGRVQRFDKREGESG
jgi:DNA polymerase-1